MKKFDKDKYLKKLKFKREWRKYERYFYIGVSCLIIAILEIYFAYSKFSSSKEEEVVRTTVGEFIHGDVVIGAYIDGEYSQTIPRKSDGYAIKNVVCDNGAIGEWDNDKWGLLTTNMTKRSKCNVYFSSKIKITSENTKVILGRALIYTGQPQTQTVEKIIINGLDVSLDNFIISNNTATKPGRYALTVIAKDDSLYIGSIEFAFSISSSKEE